MEDGAKEDPAQSKEPKFLGKAGWVKKAPGRLLSSYKDRFIHVEKTEIVVYEKEDRQNCLERLDLENYEECHEIKSPFKKKHRLILIRSPKSGNKVHDVKFQTQTAEEKEAWIKALVAGINRAKNKVFDEVTVDETSNLEHVTRSRPKGNRSRRPPTRIHMKEVAVVSSDGILRLDLDLEDAIMPNGTHHASVDGTETAKVPPSNASEAAEKQARTRTSTEEEEAQTEPESVSPWKNVIKPPMPPIKEAKSSSPLEDKPDKNDSPEKKVWKPPMPPSKEAKPSASPVEEATDEAKAEKKKAVPPPTPPNKPSSSTSNLAEASEYTHPPTPPSKDMKPSHPSVEPDQEAQGTTAENKEKEEGNEEEVRETDEAGQSIHEEALPSDDKSESPSAEGQVSDEESEETMSSGINEASHSEPQIPTEQLRKSLNLPLDLKKMPEKLQHLDDNTTQTNEGQDPSVLLPTASDTSSSSPQAEEALPKSEASSAVVSVNVSDSLSLSPLLCLLPGEKKKKAEEKSVDSGQHSDDDSEASGGEDTLAVSTAALRGSHAGLDALDTSEDDIQTPVSLGPIQVPPKPQVRPRVFPYRRSEPTPLLKPSTKARSASIGDLLSDSDSSVCIQVRQHTVAGGDTVPSDELTKLKTEVALEMENTKEILSRVSQCQGGGDGEGMPEDLLIKAMEKLKKADHVLREVNKLKLAESTSSRKSW